MKQKNIFRTGIMFVSLLTLSTSIITPVSYVSANEKSEDVQNSSIYRHDNYNREFEYFDNHDGDDLGHAIMYNLEFQENYEDNSLEFRGVKSKAAKVAAKEAIKKLKSMGRKSWNNAVKNVPFIGKTVMGWLSYDKVMGALNVVTGFEGEIESALSNDFQKSGSPKYIADMTARAIIFVLL